MAVHDIDLKLHGKENGNDVMSDEAASAMGWPNVTCLFILACADSLNQGVASI